MSDDARPDLYTCEQAVARLFEYLDRELSPEEEERVREHLDVCEGCFRHFEFDGRLLATIKEKCQTGRAPEGLRRKVASVLDRP